MTGRKSILVSASNPDRTTPFQVQIISDVSLEYFRNVVLGVRHYAFTTGKFVMASRWMDHESYDIEALLHRDRVDGIIVAAHYDGFEAKLTNLPIPVVNTSNFLEKPLLPLVTQDDVRVGELAAEHLIGCNCRSFGFWTEWGGRFAEQRLKGFRSKLREHGLEAELSVSGQRSPGSEPLEVCYDRMVRWLKELPRGVGIFSVLDTYALYLLRAVWSLGLIVPDDVAVLGAGDDEFWVKFENVPLSSVKLPSFRVGYEAAAMLEELMRKSEVPHRSRKPPPIRMLPVTDIAARQSTDALFVNDVAVVRAVRCIRENATRDLYVEEIVRASGIARTALQRRFKDVFGHSLMDELRKVRIQIAQELLSSSDLSMDEVAERCGLPSSHRLSVVFRDQTGISPMAYRKRFRMR